jgi:hypothetical protein
MRRSLWLRVCLLASVLGVAWPQLARADFELTDAQGRRIVLKDNGTWNYVDAKEGATDKGQSATPATPAVQADLQLLLRRDAPAGCQFGVMLTNHLPYEIESLVLEFGAQRANGVVYASKSTGFASVRPGNRASRPLLFEGIACQDIAKLQVLGGDRCEMGELNRFTDAKGRCLALVRVEPSDLLKFEK